VSGTIRGRLIVLALGATILVPIAPPADAATRTGNFVVSCRYSHSLPDDPIVFPGLPGASHLHDFFGNITTTAASTAESMLAGTALCKEVNDTAGYWAPTGYMNGVPVTPLVMRIYYLGQPNEPLETIPPGLQMIGGNKDATSPAENPHVRWFCGSTIGFKTPLLDKPYDCSSWADLYGFVEGSSASWTCRAAGTGWGCARERHVQGGPVMPSGFRTSFLGSASASTSGS
jgi:hypothetical protein